MPYFIVDVLDRVGQRVTADAQQTDPSDMRFVRVHADGFSAALAQASFVVSCRRAAKAIAQGQPVVLSDKQIDYLIDHGMWEDAWVSAHNPGQVGVLDAYVCATVSHPRMAALRQAAGLPAYGAVQVGA